MNLNSAATQSNNEISATSPMTMLRQRAQNLARPLQDDETQDSLEIVVFYLGAQPHEKRSAGTKRSQNLPSNAFNNGNALPDASSMANAIVTGHYAFETAQVREVFPISEASQIAILPGTPPWIRGILNVRGHILAVLDLQKLFGLPAFDGISNAPVLILRGEAGNAKTTAETLSSGGRAGSAETMMQAGDVALATMGVAGVRLLPRAQLETGHALDGTPGGRYLRGLTQDGIALLDAALLLSDANLIVQAE